MLDRNSSCFPQASSYVSPTWLNATIVSTGLLLGGLEELYALLDTCFGKESIPRRGREHNPASGVAGTLSLFRNSVGGCRRHLPWEIVLLEVGFSLTKQRGILTSEFPTQKVGMI